MKIIKKLPIPLFCIAVALISLLILMPVTTNVDNHEEAIAQIDDKISKVLKLTAGATGASAAISLIPDDTCTPIAEELAELGKYFLVVLSVLYLEKYMLTLIGYVSFGFLIPCACIMGIVFYFGRKGSVARSAAKIVIFALVLYAVIPLSMRVSDGIYRTYDVKIDQTINQAEQISIANEDQSALDQFIGWIGNAATTVINFVTELLGKFIESIAILIVTACIIPLAVVAFVLWLLKYMFSINTPVTVSALPPFKHLKKGQKPQLLEYPEPELLEETKDEDASV